MHGSRPDHRNDFFTAAFSNSRALHGDNADLLRRAQADVVNKCPEPACSFVVSANPTLHPNQRDNHQLSCKSLLSRRVIEEEIDKTDQLAKGTRLTQNGPRNGLSPQSLNQDKNNSTQRTDEHTCTENRLHVAFPRN